MTNPIEFNEREIAQILHALRIVQCDGRLEGCLIEDCDHFRDTRRLTNKQIDRLCERINSTQFEMVSL